MLHIPNSAEGNCLTEKENHTLCLKSDIKSINLRITKKYNAEKQSRLRPPCFCFFSRGYSAITIIKATYDVCTSCKTSYNVLSRLVTGSNFAYGVGG